MLMSDTSDYTLYRHRASLYFLVIKRIFSLKKKSKVPVQGNSKIAMKLMRMY